MKLNKILPIALLAGVLMLSACGNKGSNGDSGNGSSSDSGDSTQSGPVYTVTESEYASLRTFLNSTKLLTEGNMTLSGETSYKFADGRAEYEDEDLHTIFDFIYDSFADEYEIDEYDELFTDSWSKTHWAANELSLEDVSNILDVPFDFMPLSFADLTYSEETHKYISSNNGTSVEVGFEDGNLVSYTFEYDDNGIQTRTYAISNYGTTTVTLPEVTA